MFINVIVTKTTEHDRQKTKEAEKIDPVNLDAFIVGKIKREAKA